MGSLPSRLSDLRDWAANFSARIAAAPSSYGLTAPDAAAIASAVAAFTAAYTLASDPSTRTRATVAGQQAARGVVAAVLQRYAGIIRANPGVSAALRAGLGLANPDPEPTPIPAPDSFPLIGILGATPLRHELRFSDSSAPDRRAKPRGAAALQLFRIVGAEEAPSPAAVEAGAGGLVGTFTKNPLRIDHRPADAGKVATYFGRWVTRRGLTGPWSSGTSFTIAA